MAEGVASLHVIGLLPPSAVVTVLRSVKTGHGALFACSCTVESFQEESGRCRPRLSGYLSLRTYFERLVVGLHVDELAVVRIALDPVAVGVFELRALPGFALQAPIVGIFVGDTASPKALAPPAQALSRLGGCRRPKGGVVLSDPGAIQTGTL